MSRETWKLASQRSPECPSVEKWAAYLDSPAAAEHAGLAKHRQTCAACEAEVAMLTSFLAAEPQPHEVADLEYVTGRLSPRPAAAAPAEPGRAWWEWLVAPSAFRGWAVAALAMLTLAIGLQWRSTVWPPVSQDLEGEMRAVRSVEGVTPAGDLAQAPGRIEWRPVEGATSYQVQILGVDGAEIWRSGLTNQPFCDQLPTEGIFLPRKTVLVRVTALATTGQPVAVSQDVRLRVIPAAPVSNKP